MSELDLQAIEQEFLQQCGPCDFGVDSAGCNCPQRDYRNTMLGLVSEVARLRAEVASTTQDDVEDDDTCSCESYDCHGECCGLGKCTCSPRIALLVDDDNGVHVRVRVYAAANGHEHLGLAGQLVMRTAEFAALREQLKPLLADRPGRQSVSEPTVSEASTEVHLEHVRTDDGAYRVFEPNGVGTGSVTYDPANGDYGCLEVSGALSQDFDGEAEERLCHEALWLHGYEGVFERLECVYRRQSAMNDTPSDQATGGTRG